MPRLNSCSAAGQSQSKNILTCPNEICASASVSSISSALSAASFAFEPASLGECSKRRGGHAVRVGDPDIGEGVIGIKLSRLLIIFDAFSQAVFRPLIPEVAATQVELIGWDSW